MQNYNFMGQNPDDNLNMAQNALNKAIQPDLNKNMLDPQIAKYIDNLTAFGVFTPEQGQFLKQNYLNITNALNAPKVAKDNVFKENVKEIQNLSGGKILSENLHSEDDKKCPQNAKNAQINEILSGFDEFISAYPEFFNSRADLKAYLKENGVHLDKAEFEKIAKMVEALEMQAVENYKQDLMHQKTKENLNNEALSRLQTNSATDISTTSPEAKTRFTRAQIRNMTADEFKKNEKEIMEQLAKGLIN